MAYEVLARRWRPRTFAEVVGQQHVLQVLTKAFENNRLHHAYLFTGTRGVGKTTLARIVAKCLNCEQGVSAKPCGECGVCRSIDEGKFPDLLEIDAASRTRVEEMRELLSDSSYVPTQGRFKVYLIDEVHMLSTHSFNALLKTLEEPPEHLKFLFATTDPQKLPATVLSRCLQFHLKCLTESQVCDQLAKILEHEKLESEPEAVIQLARAADGSMRDGLSLLDQAINYCSAGLTQDEVGRMLGLLPRENFGALVMALSGRDPEAVMQAVASLRELSPSFQDILDDLARVFHVCAMASEGVEADTPEEMQDWVRAINAAYSPADLQLGYQVLLQGKRDLQYAPDEQTGLEMTLLRLLCFMPAGWQTEGSSAPQPAASDTSAPPQSQDALPAESKPAVSTKPIQWDEGMDWATLIEQLGVRGTAKVFADHCAVERIEGDAMHLMCDKNYPTSPEVEKTLGKALSQYFQRKISLHVRLGVPQQETKAQKDENARKERAAQAQREIEESPTLRALQEELGAQQVIGPMNGMTPPNTES